MKTVNRNAILALCLIAAIALTACSKMQAANLMAGISAQPTEGKPADHQFIQSTADFSVELFNQTITAGENSLVSPLSVLIALSMTANGADNQTLSQMEEVLANGLPIEELNNYLYTYINNLPSEDKSKLSIANSIWFRDEKDRLTVAPDFLQTNADYYQADAYQAAFDNTTVQDINNWVKAKTDGLIDSILEEVPSDAVMYLINALVFDAEWKTIYTKNQISSREFISIDGTNQPAEFMNSEEYLYLEDDSATGFIKPYANGHYSFVALLPNENIAIEDYIATLSGSNFLDIIKNAQQTSVITSLPKFSYDYTILMNNALQNLGMQDAFSGVEADFTRLGRSTHGNIFISKVLHKTYISVDERGTKAGAVTKVEMTDGAAPEERYVILNRPFVYSIIDNTTNLPVFIGTVMNIE